MKPIRRDSVIQFVAVNAILGVIIGLVFVGCLLGFDYQGIRSLLGRTDATVPALALMFGGFAITFGSVVCGSAIMALGRPDADSGQALGARLALLPVKIRTMSASKPDGALR